MSDIPARECEAKYKAALPPQGLDESLPISDYAPLLQRIEADTQSTLFLANGKAYTKFAQRLHHNHKESGDDVFNGGVKAHVVQAKGRPNELIFEEPVTGKKETVHLNKSTGRIESDKVEFCGVFRERHWDTGEIYRGYGFPGGIIELDDSGSPHLKKLE